MSLHKSTRLTLFKSLSFYLDRWWVLLLYAIVALFIDTLATENSLWLINWGVIYYKLSCGFELSTFILWFVIPLVLTVKHIDIRQFTFSRWQRRDVICLLMLSCLCGSVVGIIPYVTELQYYYPTHGDIPLKSKFHIAVNTSIWNLSWLMGWEYLLRYVLLTRLEQRFPGWGRYIVTAVEFVFHLQKAIIEALGALVLSLILNHWAIKRRNVLFPFILHLMVEECLMLYRLIG